jgi:hypothetical protein
MRLMMECTVIICVVVLWVTMQARPYDTIAHDCMFDQLDNPFQNCKFLTTSAVANLCATGTDEELRSVSLYRVDNAFNRIEMGRNPHGIFMGAAIDVMHSVQHGLHMYALGAFMKPLGPTLQTKLDLMANAFNKTCRQSIRQNFPRAHFARIINLTQIECSERSGVLFLLTAIIMNEDGWNIVEQAIANVTSVLHTMECLLCFLDLFVLQQNSSQLTPRGECVVSACTEYHLANYNGEAFITCVEMFEVFRDRNIEQKYVPTMQFLSKLAQWFRHRCIRLERRSFANGYI